MSIARSIASSAIGLLLMVGCGEDKSGGGTGDADNSDGVGSAPSGKGGSAGTSGAKTNGGKNGSIINATAGKSASAGNNSGTGSNGTAGNNSGTGSNGTAGNNSNAGANSTNGGAGNKNTAGNSSSTVDPNPASGGKGNTDDPIALGGSGNTNDPVGGNGSTGDPIGGNGNTGDPMGGKGNTGDPMGGKGNTGDPIGGKGNTADPPKKCVPSEMDNVNVIVFKDATPTGADSEGGMYVGGDLTTSGYSVGAGEGANLTCNDWGLVVGGSIVGTVTVKNSKIAYTGTASNATTTCSPGKFRAAPVDFVALESRFIGYSLAFKDYPTNGTVSGSLVLTGTDKALNVFSITTAQLDAASQIKFSAPADSSIIVNVSGTALNWRGKGFVLPDGGVACRGSTTETWCRRILWNFYEAEKIELGGIGVQGTILAPYATQSGSGGNVDGQVIVKYLTGGIEYHPYYFTGCLVFPTPS